MRPVTIGGAATPRSLRRKFGEAPVHVDSGGLDGQVVTDAAHADLATADSEGRPNTAVYAILAGGCFGFLRHNFPPARIFS